jgi:Phage gp6-like head-tail connector protein
VAVATDALTTLANLKAAVGIATADTSKDTYLEQCINRATWLIEEMTGRKFNEGMNGGFKARKYTDITSPSTHTTTGVANEDYIYFSGSTRDYGGDTVIDDHGNGAFYLPAYPVRPNAETQSVTFALATLQDRSSGGGESWDTTSYVEFDQFIVDRPNGVLRLIGGVFAPGTRNYRVTMAAGFLYGAAQPYVPPDLEALCIEMAKGIFRDNRNVTSESLGTWSRSYSKDAEDPVIQRTLARYSRPVL